MQKQAGANLREVARRQMWLVGSAEMLPVGKLAGHAHERERRHHRLLQAELLKGRGKAAGQGLVELGVPGLEALVDSQALDGEPAHPVSIFRVEVEVGL